MRLGERTSAQIERLALLSEELGEAQQVIGKILRHGMDSHHPNGGSSNASLLVQELGDVKAAITIMLNAGDFTVHALRTAKERKLAHVGEYLHYAENRRSAVGASQMLDADVQEERDRLDAAEQP